MKKITLKKMRPASFILAVLFLTGLSSSAQNFCNNEQSLWSENFGTGTTSTTSPDIVNLNFQGLGVMNTPGTYRSINFGDQNPNWHKTPDHTPNDVDGKMIVIDGKAGDFYSHVQSSANGYPAGFYSFNFWAINLMGLNNCGPNSLKPVLRTRAEYRDQNGIWVDLINSPVTAAPIAETNTPVWVHLGGTFTLPTTGNFIVTEIRCTITDISGSGCGNDFAIDDIAFSVCSDDGPVPVTFLNISTQKKGVGVNILWATGSESNNKYFDVEKSTDGTNWTVVANIASAGNSSITKNYTAYDAKPVAGINYYRIKQVDNDGRSKLSSIASYNLKITSTDVSVLSNPFKNNITIDFLSTTNQVVNSRLFEISGKQVLSQQLNITKGSTRKVIDGVNKLNRGMYILQITNENGEILYNEKLIKE